MSLDAGPIKAVFFDIRDTLGVVDRRGHLIKFKPSTDQLLLALKDSLGVRIGLITNLPANVSSADGFAMIEEAGIAPFLDPQGFVTNHDAQVDKPDPRIFHFAAERMSLAPSECLFCGENLIEVLAAEVAGMKGVVKPFPPGRDFLLRPVAHGATTATSSGRLAEIILEEEHLVGKRIVVAAANLGKRLAQLAADETPPLRAMGLVVWLTKHFIDPFHHRKEEEVLVPFALARGLDPSECQFVAIEHQQGRLYFDAMDTALNRIRDGNRSAVRDFHAAIEGFVELYRAHGAKEDDVLLKKAGELFSEADDALVVDLMARIGPVDVTLYYQVIGELEAEVPP